MRLLLVKDCLTPYLKSLHCLPCYTLYFYASVSNSNREILKMYWVLTLLKGICFSDDGQRPSFEAGRVIIGFWWVFTILITASYTANLAAFLTISLAKPPVKNLEELASQTTYKPLIVQETNHHDMFRVSENFQKKLWKLCWRFFSLEVDILRSISQC